MNRKNDGKNVENKIVESGDIMPQVAVIEREKEQYYIDMKIYFDKLKSMSKGKAIELAKSNLTQAGIIDEDGNLTDRYKNSRQK